MSKTRILQCTCKHTTQDKLHGEGNRVFNSHIRKPNGSQDYTCTVCGAVQTKTAKKSKKEK